MSFDLHALLDLWTQPPADDSEAVEAFRRLYADPVPVNGAALSAADLVERARSLQQALDHVHREVLEVCDAGRRWRWPSASRVATSDRWRPRPGCSSPPVKWLSLRVIDVLSISDGKISAVTMVADELGALAAVDAAALVG